MGSTVPVKRNKLKRRHLFAENRNLRSYLVLCTILRNSTCKKAGAFSRRRWRRTQKAARKFLSARIQRKPLKRLNSDERNPKGNPTLFPNPLKPGVSRPKGPRPRNPNWPIGPRRHWSEVYNVLSMFYSSTLRNKCRRSRVSADATRPTGHARDTNETGVPDARNLEASRETWRVDRESRLARNWPSP